MQLHEVLDSQLQIDILKLAEAFWQEKMTTRVLCNVLGNGVLIEEAV